MKLTLEERQKIKRAELDALEERKRVWETTSPEDRARVLTELWKIQQSAMKSPRMVEYGRLGAIATARSPRFAAYTERRRQESIERKIEKVRAKSRQALARRQAEYEAQLAAVEAEHTRIARARAEREDSVVS